METPVVPTQPDVAAAVNAALELEPVQAAPQVPEPTPEPAPFDPASFTIPDRITESAPKALDKFKNKTLLDIAKSYEESEKGFHAKAQESAQIRRENEELKARLAAAEQFAKMAQQPAPAPTPHDPWQGVNPDAEIITDPRRVLDRTLSESERRAQLVAQQEAQKVRAEIIDGLRAEKEEAAIFNTFEIAKFKLRQAGYELPDEQWKDDLTYIAPRVAKEGKLFDPDAYVGHFQKLRGPIKATLPREGNPPVAARAATAPPSVPTISSEERQLRERLANVWGMTGDERKNYIERGGRQ